MASTESERAVKYVLCRRLTRRLITSPISV